MKPILILSTTLFVASVHAAEGFQPSYERNVVMLKSRTNRGTAFIFRDPSRGHLIVTQQHVIEGQKSMILQWGHKVESLFRLEAVEDGTYQLSLRFSRFGKTLSWMLPLKPPQQLLQYCKCSGFEEGSFRQCPASLIGYPILERRIWPSINKWLWMWKELWANVIQQVSVGNVCKEGKEYLGDMDSISGNSGGPVLQDGKVIGVIHHLKTWKGEGYQYKDPYINFVPIQTVMEALNGLENPK